MRNWEACVWGKTKGRAQLLTCNFKAELQQRLILSELVRISKFHCSPMVKRKQCFPLRAITLLKFLFFAIPHEPLG